MPYSLRGGYNRTSPQQRRAESTPVGPVAMAFVMNSPRLDVVVALRWQLSPSGQKAAGKVAQLSGGGEQGLALAADSGGDELPVVLAGGLRYQVRGAGAVTRDRSSPAP